MSNLVGEGGVYGEGIGGNGGGAAEGEGWEGHDFGVIGRTKIWRGSIDGMKKRLFLKVPRD